MYLRIWAVIVTMILYPNVMHMVADFASDRCAKKKLKSIHVLRRFAAEKTMMLRPYQKLSKKYPCVKLCILGCHGNPWA